MPEKHDKSTLNRVRVPSRFKRGQFFFGVHVPGTRGTVILDGKKQRVLDVEPKEMQFH